MPHIEPAAVLSMAGTIRTKEKCPKCSAPFTGEPLSCVRCLTRPQKLFIDIYVKGKGRIKLYSDRSGNPFHNYAHAERSLIGIRYEIDQKIFDPSNYVFADKRNFLFETQIERWYNAKLKEVEIGNLAASYVRSLRRYKDDFYLRYFTGRDVRDIRAYNIEEFYRNLPEIFMAAQNARKEKAANNNKRIVERTKWSLKYVRNVMTALESFFADIERIERIAKAPVFPQITLDRKAPRWTDRKSQVEILDAIPEADRDIFLFLAFQGVRPGEARALKVKDIDIEDESFIAARTFSDRKIVERTKSKVVRPRALNPVLLPMLRRLSEGKHPEAFIFISPRTGKLYSEDALFDIWDRARKIKNINLTLYQATRHSFASNLLRDGVDIAVISRLLGHTDIRTTMIYAHADLGTQRVAFRKSAESNVIALCPQTVPETQKAAKK